MIITALFETFFYNHVILGILLISFLGGILTSVIDFVLIFCLTKFLDAREKKLIKN